MGTGSGCSENRATRSAGGNERGAVVAARLEVLDRLLLALSERGFSLPFAATVRDYPGDPAGLRAADEQAWANNRAALEGALHRCGIEGPR